MKRKIILISLALTLILTGFAIYFFKQATALSEDELQKRAEDYQLLLDSLQEVGYEENFSLKESKSMEQNLRRLWLNESSFIDPRKNAELLVILKNHDFIGEGLKRANTYDESTNPYYDNWPYDSQYITASRSAGFDDKEVQWLLLLLSEGDLSQSQPDLYEVLFERGMEAFQYGSCNTWPYFEINYPGYLEELDPAYWEELVSEGLVTVFHNLDNAVQKRIVQAIDIEKTQSNSGRPRLILSLSEAEELMQQFPPEGKWDGGYIRVVEPEITGFGTQQPAKTLASVYERPSDGVLAAVTHPADARFLIYEEYIDRKYYSTYYSDDGRDRSFDLYLWLLHIRITDLITGEEIFNEKKWGNPPPEEISISYITQSATITSDDEYNYNDFDYDRYANVIVEYLNQSDHDS